MPLKRRRLAKTREQAPDVLIFPDPALDRVARQVDLPGEAAAAQDVIDALVAAAEPRGCDGLAAPQIGSDLAIIVLAENGRYRAFINPVLTGADDTLTEEAESCASLPSLSVQVRRHSNVEVSWQDLDGSMKTETFSGRAARQLQHECDHLDGIQIVQGDGEGGGDHDFLRRRGDVRAIARRLTPFLKKPDGLLHHRRGLDGHIIVAKDGTQIAICFSHGDAPPGRAMTGIMSRIDILNPLSVLGVYAQAMTACLAFCSAPDRVYVLGAGGGIIPMLILNTLPDTFVEGSEIDPAVLQISRRYFGMAKSDRLAIAPTEGRRHLQQQPDDSYDHIYLDCFAADAWVPGSLSTVEFFRSCHAKLRPGGVICMNLSEGDPNFLAQIAGFAEAFSTVWHFEHKGAHVIFGMSAQDQPPADLAGVARNLQKRFQFDFDLSRRVRQIAPLNRARIASALPLFDRDIFDRGATDPDSTDTFFLGCAANDSCPCGSGVKFKTCHGRNPS